MTAVAQRQSSPARKRRAQARPQRLHLSEDFAVSKGPLKVDREKKCIYGVKVLGWESVNNRRYLPEAGRDAVNRRLYEGAKVYTNHPGPSEKNRSRDVEDGFGRLTNTRWENDGVYGDLLYFENHPMAARILEDVERGVGFFGLSHNAWGEGETRDGVFVVAKIAEVNSVDLVSDGATVKNLWESRDMAKKISLRDAIITSQGRKREYLAKLLEWQVFEADDTMASPDGGAAAAGGEEPGWKEHLLNAISTLLDSDDEDAKKTIDSIMKLLNPKTKPAEEDDEKKDEPKKDDEKSVKEDDEKKDDDKKKDDEKKAEESRQYRRLEKGLALCESSNVFPSAPIRKQLSRCENDQEMKELVEFYAKNTKTGNGPVRPKSQSPGMGGNQSRTPVALSESATAKDFGRFLKFGR
jgi:hypothetical protein